MTRRHINKQKHQFFNILFLNYKLTEASKFDNDKELEKSRHEDHPAITVRGFSEL